MNIGCFKPSINLSNSIIQVRFPKIIKKAETRNVRLLSIKNHFYQPSNSTFNVKFPKSSFDLRHFIHKIPKTQIQQFYRISNSLIEWKTKTKNIFLLYDFFQLDFIWAIWNYA